MLTRSKIAEIRGLASRKGRSESPFFPAEGEKLAGELLESSFETECVYYVEDTIAPELKSRILRSGKGEAVTATQMERITLLKTPTPVLALIRKPHYTFDPATAGNELTLALDGVQDPGNLGTIIRAGEGAGITGVVMSSDTADIYNPKVIRSTMGSVLRVPFVYASDLKEACEQMKKAGISLYAAHLKGMHNYDQEDYTKDTGFLIGNEAKGLTDEMAAVADTYIKIPMAGQVESLNAAVASSVLMFEAARQRRNS